MINQVVALSALEIVDTFPDATKEILNLKRAFGDKYVIEVEGAYKLERPELRDAIEWYYVIPAQYGHFFLYGGMTMAFYCTANRIKEAILRQFKGKVTLFVECEDESILLFDKKLLLEIAPISKAKRRRGRKALPEIEKKALLEAGKKYQFMGKSLQHTGPEEAISPKFTA
jgi:uncharacterized membrane protein